jgi:hypothetical protein
MTQSPPARETKTMNAKTDTKPKLVSDEEQLARLTRKEEAALDAAIEELAKAKRARNKGSIEIAQAKIDGIADKKRQRTFEAGRRRDLDETVALAEARGEEVVRPKRGGARILTRQGIQQAYEDGHMTPALGALTADHLHATAKAYRDAYEIAAGLAGRSGEGGGYGAKGPQIKIVEAGEALAIMRLDLTQRQIDILDRVCGQDMRLREAATVLGRGFPSTKNSLIMGLKAATLNIRAARAVRDQGEPTTKARLESARAQVDAAMRSAG